MTTPWWIGTPYEQRAVTGDERARHRGTWGSDGRCAWPYSAWCCCPPTPPTFTTSTGDAVTTIHVTKQTEVTFDGKFTLGELRAFVEQCRGVADGAGVQVKHHDAVSPRDITSTTITVLGAA